ncbi:helix-turn-helix domain-containing protein [Enterococcus sp. LJL128]
MIDLARFLKQRRKDCCLTQEEVAGKILVNQKSISNWENGKTVPDIYNLSALAKLYDFSLDKLLLKESKMMNDIKVIGDTQRVKRWLKLAAIELVIGVASLIAVTKYIGTKNSLGVLLLTGGAVSIGMMVDSILKAILVKTMDTGNRKKTY